jgi:hypothetical protein
MTISEEITFTPRYVVEYGLKWPEGIFAIRDTSTNSLVTDPDGEVIGFIFESNANIFVRVLNDRA